MTRYHYLCGRRIRHRANGGTYRVLFACTIEATDTPALAYWSEYDGRVWVRPAEEFGGGRFEIVDSFREPIRFPEREADGAGTRAEPEAAESWRDRLVFDPAVSTDSPIVRHAGGAITAGLVAEKVASGMPREDVAAVAGITLEDVDACLAYTEWARRNDFPGDSWRPGSGGNGPIGPDLAVIDDDAE